MYIAVFISNPGICNPIVIKLLWHQDHRSSQSTLHNLYNCVIWVKQKILYLINNSRSMNNRAMQVNKFNMILNSELGCFPLSVNHNTSLLICFLYAVWCTSTKFSRKFLSSNFRLQHQLYFCINPLLLYKILVLLQFDSLKISIMSFFVVRLFYSP